MPSQTQNPAQQAFVIKIVWGALTLSQIIYLLVIFMLQKSGQPTNPNAHLQLWGPAIFDGLIALALFRKSLSSDGLTKIFTGIEPKKALAKAFSLYIICWALNESVAIMGFVTAFTGDKSPLTMAPYTVAGVLLNLLMFPKLDTYLRSSSESQGPVH